MVPRFGEFRGTTPLPMRILRSWPRNPPADRSYVIDGTERFVMDVDYDYRRLANYQDDILILEWDIAVDPDQLADFVDRIEPGRVRVAPYRLYYQYSDDPWNPHQPVWAHRCFTAPGKLRWVTDYDKTCHLFAFGLTYLPGELLARFCADRPGPLGDSSFSHWHYENAPDPEVTIDWDCRPIHLNHPPLEESIHGTATLR